MLKTLWLATDQMCSKKLVAAIPLWLPFYERTHGTLDDELRANLLSISPATLDRLLTPGRGRCGTKPGSLLRTQIPIRTSSWDISRPGFLHTDRPGRPSLALDLMEELRAYIADRLVLSLINRKQLGPQHFESAPGGAHKMTDKGRKIVLTTWQKRKQDAITHPFIGEKMHLGLLPFTQALLLARFLRGDLEAYPPFLSK